ncbi:MAG TPA: hypothetical protein VK943_14465 [Arenibaculum sp.]|nr:hypothetical protein [Arenibaculum sp.]
MPSARFMGGREYEIVRAGRNPDHDEADLERVLEAGVMLLPAVEPASGPFRGRDARWTVEPASQGERALALAWYLALMTGVCLSLIGAEGPIVVEGPFARNVDFLEMLEISAGRPVEANAGSVTGTSIGAALLAAPSSKPASSGDGPLVTGRARRLAAYADAWKRAVCVPV